MAARRSAAPLFALALSGCSGWQSALDPKGPQAQHLAELIWGFTIVCTIIWLLVMIALGFALLRRRAERPDPLTADIPRERRAMHIVIACTIATAVIVLALTGLSYVSQRKLYAREPGGITIRVTGYQWWWDVRYEDARPDRIFTTANELRIPVGEPVTVKLASTDVIHSFWVPSLAGKLDLIPGQDNEIQFTASRPGVYRGQCAEFCGWQHARMAMLVYAVPKDEFERWRESQIKPADPPSDPERQKGEQVFLSNSCVLCHTVRGTAAGSRAGPDLTHLASRSQLAAATLPMSRGNLAAWVVDPQGIKPGANMPMNKLQPDELEWLVSYLAGLK
jgi:cytochrome c oxidase subunit 2